MLTLAYSHIHTLTLSESLSLFSYLAAVNARRDCTLD